MATALVRDMYHRFLLVPGVPSFFGPAQRNCATVFMCHRFEDKNRGIHGFDPALLKRGLQYLRKHKYELISLTELFNRLAGNGPSLHGAVVFTIDDGYIDQAEIAAPLFAEFDCPVTVFATTGFLDGELWMWWDKIAHTFATTRRSSVAVQLGGEAVRYNWRHQTELKSACDDVIQRCKVMEDEEKHAAIEALAESAGVDLQHKPPQMYAPMTWSDARACEAKGMSFGPHTITHPILSRTPDEQAVREISGSWQRLCSEVRNPTPVFCYPNGQWPDFGFRETSILRNAGLLGAVTGEPGFPDTSLFSQGNDEPFKIRRLPFPESLSELIQYVSGIERCKQVVRRLT